MHDIIDFLKKSVWFRRSVALFFHAGGIALSVWLAFQLRFDFAVSEVDSAALRIGLLWGGSGFFIAILLFGLYRGLWRFFTLRDCFMTAFAIGVGAIIGGAAVYFGNGMGFIGFPRSTILITALILLVWEVGCRGLIRVLREHRIRVHREGEAQGRVLLVGNPDEADSLLRNMVRHPRNVGKVVGLVSDSKRHHGQQLRGVKIYGGSDLVPDIVEKQSVTTVLFLPPFNSPSVIRNVVEAVGRRGLPCEYRTLPSMEDLASGRVTVDKIRKVSIEDLLHRPQHDIDLQRVASTIQGKRVMVTGAGGSIGSEICRQILKLGPQSLTLFDSSEYLLFEIERELAVESSGSKVQLIAVTGDVRRPDNIERAIDQTGGIDVLYHAAAYKHVHLMERNPVACFQNNVIGTDTVASVAEQAGVKDFVLVSTDKAVRPTSLMGASKRLAERVLIERPKGKTRFKAVRFGNVLGSSGSVIPIFRKQIAEGGPVTVTSKKVTRYFMTIPEAVELVIAAGAFAEDRQICILEMGEPVTIESLARRMIELSGFVPDVDIPIIYTGLKSGEKEYEELLTDDEGVVRTDHDRIWVLQKSHEVDAPPLVLSELIAHLDKGDSVSIRNYAHENVPGSLLLAE
ncbi:MAG: nucleoside-diphosphate sugar epimerase/dehydratase [Verrucomicrobiales bacterium]|nr:nucleoside-diphosphate sugar epimerase/dehydratase [Verrucomicrobiales bacterium]